jgi:hypothetical protein
VQRRQLQARSVRAAVALKTKNVIFEILHPSPNHMRARRAAPKRRQGRANST